MGYVAIAGEHSDVASSSACTEHQEARRKQHLKDLHLLQHQQASPSTSTPAGQDTRHQRACTFGHTQAWTA